MSHWNPRAARNARGGGLRTRLLVTLALIALFRLGQYLPLPDVDVRAVHYYDPFPGAVKFFTGDALPRFAVLGLGVYPYLIARELVSIAALRGRRLQALSAAGPAGQARLRQIERYFTPVAAGLMSAWVAVVVPAGALHQQGVLLRVTLAAVLTAGSVVSLLVAELIDRHGVGSGCGLLIATQILSVLPGEFHQVLQRHGSWALVGLLALILGLLLLNSLMERAQRRIPLQQAKAFIGRRMYGGTTMYLPIRLASADSGADLAAAVLFGLGLVASVGPHGGWIHHWVVALPGGARAWYLAALCLLIFFFTCLRAVLDLDPERQADRLKAAGAFIPGIRFGRPTAEYLSYVLGRLTLVGALYRVAAALAVTGAAALMAGTPDATPYGVGALFLALSLTAEFAAELDQESRRTGPAWHYEGILR